MNDHPERIVFATDQPTLLAGFRKAIRHTEFNAEPMMLRPRAAYASLRGDVACLFFVDASRVTSSNALAQTVRSSPQTRFVLTGNFITPEMLRMAFDTGIHGVLSINLPDEEAADAIVRIWNGERQFRFDTGLNRRPAPMPLPAPAPPQAEGCDDFDRAWMFGLAG